MAIIKNERFGQEKIQNTYCTTFIYYYHIHLTAKGSNKRGIYDMGIADTYSRYSPVKIWYDGIISANFQEWSGETCLNLMNFFLSHVETYER